MSNELKIQINISLLIFGLGGFVSAILAYADLRSEVKAARIQNTELRELMQPLVEKVNRLDRDVELIKSEMKHFPKAINGSADNRPLWKYNE